MDTKLGKHQVNVVVQPSSSFTTSSVYGMRLTYKTRLCSSFALGILGVILSSNLSAQSLPVPSEASKLPTQRELEAMSRDEAMEFLLSTYKKQIDNIVEQVIANAPAQYWGSLQGSKIVYSREETPFAFYVASKQSKAIHICLGGINVLDIASTALAVSLYVEDTQWWLKYMLLHRALRKQPGAVWLDPLDVAGISEENSPAEAVTRMALFSHNALGEMLYFMIAHEVGHVALEHSGEAGSDESQTSYLERARRQELEADSFAFQVLGSMDANPLSVVLALLTHLVVFENPISSDEARHPPDHSRIRGAVDYFSKAANSKSRQGLAVARGLADAFSVLPSYQVLDLTASSTTRESLRAWPRTAPPVGNANSTER